MADKKAKHTFPKGNDFWKKRKSKLPEDVKTIANSNLNELKRSIVTVENLLYNERKEIDKNTLTLMERAILEVYEKRNWKAIEYLQNRIYGKVTDKVRLVDDNDNDRELIISDAFLPKLKDEPEPTA